MTVTYCTAADVAAFLQIDSFTTPSTSQVEALINQAEDYIDKKTKHSWQEKTVTNEYARDLFPEEGESGYKIYMGHRAVKSLTSGTDKIEVWNGSEWVEWVASKTEGRGDDFWCEYEQGILHLVTLGGSYKPNEIRLTYRYGETTVPGDIKEACAKLVARNIVFSDDKSMVLPEGTDNLPFEVKARQWKKDAMEIIHSYAEWSPAG